MPIDKRYGLEGVGPDVQLGRRGPRLIVSSGVVAHRNSTDTAYARSQGATPIVGADLVTKDYVDGKLGALPSLDAYDSVGGGTVAGAPSWSDVPLGANRQIDAEFTHVPPSPLFIFNGTSGTKVLVTGRITVTPPGAAVIRGRIMLDTGAGFAEVTGSRGSTEVQVASGEGEVIVTAILTLSSGDRVKIQAQQTNLAGSGLFIINSSGIVAIALENPAGAAAGNVARLLDNRGSPTATGAVAMGGLADFTLAAGAGYVSMQFLRVVTASGTCANANVQFFRDAARTVQVYSALNKNPSTQYTDRNPAALLGDDGADLELDTLYGRITKNDTGTATFEIEAVLWGES